MFLLKSNTLVYGGDIIISLKLGFNSTNAAILFANLIDNKESNGDEMNI